MCEKPRLKAMPPEFTRPPRIKLRVSPAAETALRSGHPWLYATAIREQNRPGSAGELAVIYDRQNRFLAVGLYDPGSPLRVRILHRGKPVEIDARWWSHRLQQAVVRRDGLFGPDTNGYRLIYGESDGWPGLVLDRYAGTLVLKLYTAAWLLRLEEISGLLAAQLQPERLVLRLSRNIQAQPNATHPAPPDGSVLFGAPVDRPVVFLEHGLRFEADVLKGQKTGFFLDQRENRQFIRSLAAGKTVLNTFSFSGGFSLNAASGGAVAVTDVDISAHALNSARRNFALNTHIPQVTACRHETVQADTFEWLSAVGGSAFDLVVLDPPSLARREAERAGALQAYERLVRMAAARLNPGGLLLACSCSAHVTDEEFLERVRRAARSGGRSFHELRTAGHPADHRAGFKEAEYLKAVYLRFHV